MTFKQFMPIPIVIAALATSLVMLAPPSKLVIPYLWTWITFQAWAMYFMAGGTVMGGVRVMCGYLGGALASVAIFELIGVLSFLGSAGSLAAAVFIVVIPVISAERVPLFNFVPAWFVGAGVFFGVMTLSKLGLSSESYLSVGKPLMVSCAIGMVYGFVTVLFRTKYEASLAVKQPAGAE